MRRQEQVELGEQAFVGGFLGVIALEAVITIIACGIHFTWITLLAGVLGICALVYLADRLYAGQRSARLWTIVLAGVQIAVAVELFRQSAVSGTLASLAILKIIGYLSLIAVLKTPVVNVFLALRGGETLPDLAEEAPVIDKTIKPSGVVVPFTANHLKVIPTLVSSLKNVGLLLMVLGVLLLPSVYQDWQWWAIAGLLTLAQAVALVLLGWCMMAPADALQAAQAQGNDSAFVMNAFAELRSFFYGFSGALGALGILMIVKWFLPYIDKWLHS